LFRPEQLAQWLSSAEPPLTNGVAVGALPAKEEGPPAYTPTGTFLAHMQKDQSQLQMLKRFQNTHFGY
jgi:hypothetical protein